MENRIIYWKPLGNRTRTYRQERFILSTFQAFTENVRLGIERCKEMNFNMVEFGWVKPAFVKTCMSACEEVGMDGVFQNWEALGGAFESQGSRELDLNKAIPFLEYARKYRYATGFYVWDEPWEKETMAAAGKLVDQVEKLEPGKLHYTVALPSYNHKWNWANELYKEYLTNYADLVNPEVLSLDYYPFVGEKKEPFDQLDSNNLFLDLALIRELSLERDLPMWFYFQAQDDPDNGTYECLSPEKIRLQQNLALLHGAKGLQNYNVVEGALNRDSSRGPLFFATKEMNHRCIQLGKTLIALKSVGVYHSPEVQKENPIFDSYRQSVQGSEILDLEELPFRCSVGAFTDSERNRYLMILNRDYQEARTFDLKLKKEYRIYEVSKEDGMQRLTIESTDCIKRKIQPGDVVLLRLQDLEDRPFLLEYRLEKE